MSGNTHTRIGEDIDADISKFVEQEQTNKFVVSNGEVQ